VSELEKLKLQYPKISDEQLQKLKLAKEYLTNKEH